MRRFLTRDNVFDALAVLFAAGFVWLQWDPDSAWWARALATLSVVPLVFRRRWPRRVFAAELLLTIGWVNPFSLMVALYTVANRCRSLVPTIVAALLVFGSVFVPFPSDFPRGGEPEVVYFVYGIAALVVIATAVLGRLIGTRVELSRKLVEIDAAREHEMRLVSETALARERAQLAREMHDVVSHQVSLIAVRAGALQVSTTDADAKEAATTIRELGAATLDELRHMVTLLRASGSVTGLPPQPSLADLQGLLATSGISVHVNGEFPQELDPHSQRAIYRTVQEALTNVRKHAPGATATIDVDSDDTTLTVTITNTPPTRFAVALPSAQHGHIGLRERAALLGGAVHIGPTPDGGFQVRLQLPIQ